MTLKTRVGLVGILLVGLLFVTAGCGGGGGSASNSTPTTTAGGTTTSSSSGNVSGLATAANCRQLSDLGSKLASAFTGKNQDIQKQAALLKQFADSTPSDIRPDFEVLATAFLKIADALKGANLSSGKALTAAQLTKLATLSGQLNQAEIQKASTHITAWATKNCKAP